MSRVTANGIQIEYETFGNPSDRPLLLVIGLGRQLIEWDESLCQDLVSRGHYVSDMTTGTPDSPPNSIRQAHLTSWEHLGKFSMATKVVCLTP